MKLVTFRHEDGSRVGLLWDNRIYDLAAIDPTLPQDMSLFLRNWERNSDHARRVQDQAAAGKFREHSFACDESRLLAPVPHPTSCRDGYAFRLP